MAKMAKRRRLTPEFKREALERMKGCENVKALARELGISRRLLYVWRSKFESRRGASLAPTREQRTEQQLREEITKLKSALADRTLEIDFFRTALLRVREIRQNNTGAGATASTAPSSRGPGSKAESA